MQRSLLQHNTSFSVFVSFHKEMFMSGLDFLLFIILLRYLNFSANKSLFHLFVSGWYSPARKAKTRGDGRFRPFG
jgi:hypothetical protein